MATPSKPNNSGGKFLSQEQLAVATNALTRILRNVEILERIKKDIYRVARILSQANEKSKNKSGESPGH